MNKSLIALAVLSSSTAAQAVEIYAVDSTTINLSGEMDVQYYQSQTPSDDPEISLNTATIAVKPSYEVNEHLTIGTSLGVKSSDGNAILDDVAVVATIEDFHTLSIGQQSTIYDNAGIGDDYRFGFTSYIDLLDPSGDQVIKYKYDGGEVFYAGLAYSMHSNETSGDYYSSDYVADGRIGARLGDYNYTLYAAQSKTLGLMEHNYTLEARYGLGDITLAGTYGFTDTETSTTTNNNQKLYGLAATYDGGGLFSYAAGWAATDDDSESDVVNDFYFNITYYIGEGVYAYSEVGLTDDASQDTGYVIGMDVTF
jgi:predicted porin